MSNSLEFAALILTLLFISSRGAQSPPTLPLEDEIRAGNALEASFMKLNEVGETPEQKRIEKYLQTVGDKVAQQSNRKLALKFHLDPHPVFRSAEP